jgi:hypothetical protein
MILSSYGLDLGTEGEVKHEDDIPRQPGATG